MCFFCFIVFHISKWLVYYIFLVILSLIYLHYTYHIQCYLMWFIYTVPVTVHSFFNVLLTIMSMYQLGLGITSKIRNRTSDCCDWSVIISYVNWVTFAQCMAKIVILIQILEKSVIFHKKCNFSLLDDHRLWFDTTDHWKNFTTSINHSINQLIVLHLVFTGGVTKSNHGCTWRMYTPRGCSRLRIRK